MPYRYHIDREKEIAVIIGEDVWSGDDILESGRELVEDPLFEPHFDWIYDLRNIAGVDITPDHLKRMLDQFQSFREAGVTDAERSRSTIVGGHLDNALIGELYAELSGLRGKIRIVGTMEEAYSLASSPNHLGGS